MRFIHATRKDRYLIAIIQPHITHYRLDYSDNCSPI